MDKVELSNIELFKRLLLTGWGAHNIRTPVVQDMSMHDLLPDKLRNGGVHVGTGVRKRLPDPLGIKGAVRQQDRSGFGHVRAVFPVIHFVVAIPAVLAPRQRVGRPSLVIHQPKPNNGLRLTEPDDEIKKVIHKPAALRFALNLPCVEDLIEHDIPSLCLP